MDKSGNWWKSTINPVVGCTKCSPGCANCYAESMAKRWRLNPKTPQYKGVADAAGWTGKVQFVELALTKIFKAAKGKYVFLESMGDLFHEAVPDEWLDRIFGAVAARPEAIFMVLTKRPERMFEYFQRKEPIPNLWLGVTVESQDQIGRIEVLLYTPAAKRFVSMEPMLGPIRIPQGCSGAHTHSGFRSGIRGEWERHNHGPNTSFYDGDPTRQHHHCDEGCRKLDWIIMGPENGPNKRPFKIWWAQGVRDHCIAAGIPLWFKQGDGSIDGKIWRERP